MSTAFVAILTEPCPGAAALSLHKGQEQAWPLSLWALTRAYPQVLCTGVTFMRQPLAFKVASSPHTRSKCRAATFCQFYAQTEHRVLKAGGAIGSISSLRHEITLPRKQAQIAKTCLSVFCSLFQEMTDTFFGEFPPIL